MNYSYLKTLWPYPIGPVGGYLKALHIITTTPKGEPMSTIGVCECNACRATRSPMSTVERLNVVRTIRATLEERGWYTGGWGDTKIPATTDVFYAGGPRLSAVCLLGAAAVAGIKLHTVPQALGFDTTDDVMRYNDDAERTWDQIYAYLNERERELVAA